MKRNICIFGMAWLLLLCFSACGGDGIYESLSDSEHGEETTPTVEETMPVVEETRIIETDSFSTEHTETGCIETEESFCGESETIFDSFTVCESHVFGQWEVVLEQTCTQEGQSIRWCTICGHEDAKVLRMRGHDYEVTSTVAATKIMDGSTTSVCSFCEDVKTDIIPAIGSIGLEYVEVEGGYEVSGRGRCTDTEIYVPKTYNGRQVKSIGRHAFLQDKQLTKLVIPEGLTVIKYAAFYECYNLRVLLLPSSLSKVEASVFTGCRLNTVFYVGAHSDWENILFLSTSSLDDAQLYTYVADGATQLPQRVGHFWYYENGEPVKLIMTYDRNKREYVRVYED